MRAFLVAALVLLPGCILSGGPDDLTLVCERRTGAPGHPYPPEAILRVTDVAPGLDEARRDEILRDVADRLLTPNAAPYRSFNATISPGEPGTWVFDANGTWQEDGVSGVDRYVFHYTGGPDGARLADGEPQLLPVPERLRMTALEAVNRTTELDETRAARPVVGSVVWDRALPACVRVAYQTEGPSSDGEGPGVTHVWVNLARGQVVYVKDVA